MAYSQWLVYNTGWFFTLKAREQAKKNGYFSAAKNLRKQGVPFGVACMMLLGRAPKRGEG